MESPVVEKKVFSAEQYTGPSTFTPVHCHSLYSILDGVSEPWQYAKACKERGYPAMALTEHGHMGSVPDLYFACKKYGVKYIAGCFLPGQRVLLDSGVESIDKLLPGNLVVTDKNRLRPVVNVQKRDYDGEVIRVKAWGMEEVVATPEHPFLVREVVREEFKRGCWREEITVGMRQLSDVKRQLYHRTYCTKRSKDRTNKRRFRFYLCLPRLNNHNKLRTINIKEYFGEVTHTKAIIPDKLIVDQELLWIMGLWLAEGPASYGKLSFWLGGDEYHFYERISSYFAQFGLTTSCYPRKDSYALDVVVFSVHFAKVFEAVFGCGFADKRFPWWLMSSLNRQQAKVLLDGLFDGDGKIKHDMSVLKLSNESLVWQARLLLTCIGQSSAITPIECNNSDNVSYSMRRRESGKYYYDFDEDYIYLPVYDVQREQYKGPVYNIEVEDDNTYNVGVAVHNCELYLNDYEPDRKALTIPLKTVKKA